MDDPLHHGSLEPDGMPFTAMPAMPATTQWLASDGTQLITDRDPAIIRSQSRAAL